MPGVMTLAQASDVDAASLLCTPSGDGPTSEARRALSRFVGLTGDELPEAPSIDDHCPLCALAHGVPLPVPTVLIAPGFRETNTRVSRFETRFVHLAQGPPLGSRAPPTHH